MTDAAPRTEPQAERCLLCEEGMATLSHETQSFNYGPISDGVLLSAVVPVWTCEDCGEQYLGPEAEDIKHDAVCAYLGRMTPGEIRALRVSFQMLQDQFADFTGYGIASIKRWETGSQIQSESVDKHLRLLRALGVAEVTKRSAPPKTPEFRTELSPEIRERAKRFNLRIPMTEPARLAA